MTGFYCEKCNRLNPSQQCGGCGAKLSAATFRDNWKVVRLPASDGLIWQKVLIYLLIFVAVLFLVVLITGAATGKVESALSGPAIPALLAVYPMGVLLTLLLLLFQGREDMWYTLEKGGVRVQIWFRSGRLHCWSRLQAYIKDDIYPQPDGISLTPAAERTLCWGDVTRVKLQKRQGRIWLYHGGYFAPVILRIPAEEYDQAESLVKKACKGKY